MLKRLSKLEWIFYAYLLIFPFLFAFHKIYVGDIPFWFDIARDFLLAENNLINPTLIGPPSGIPGIFYGPYWIWILSLGLFFSKDPKIITIFFAVIPYLIIFPLLLLSFRKMFGIKNLLLLWFLFITGFHFYSTNLWNPYPSAILILLMIMIIVFKDFHKRLFVSKIYVFAIGILSGFLINFHISLGMGVIVGLYFYLMFDTYMSNKKESIGKLLISIFLVTFSYVFGIFIIMIPFFAFEFRHEFLQIKSFFNTLEAGFIHDSAVVAQKGFTKTEIIENIFSRLSIFLHIPVFVAFAIYGVAIGALIALRKSKSSAITFSEKELKIIYLSIFVGIGIGLVYLLTKNPVWWYHFLGIEVFILFLILIVMKKSKIFSKTISYWVMVVSIFISFQFLNSVKANNANTHTASLASPLWIINSIYEDAGNNSFGYFALSPAIHVYEFEYIFKWTANKKELQLPLKDSNQNRFTYLIIPEIPIKDRNAYIENKTPQSNFRIIKSWDSPDRSKIYKMELIK